MIAYVDESMRLSAARLYLVAAVVVVPVDVDDIRRQLRAVLLRGQFRFHWRDESEAQRVRMLQTIAALRLQVFAYGCQPTWSNQERARALCIRRMVWDLDQLGVNQVVFESREAHNDRKDAKTIEHARRAREVGKNLQYQFRRPHEDPALWMADTLAGVAASHLAKEGSGYLRSLPTGLVRIIDIAP